MRKRKNYEVKKVDYVTYDESYCHRIEPKMKQLCYFSFNKRFTLQAMKNKIYEIVQGATLTDKMAWFLNTVSTCKSKKKLYYLCKNSVNKAERTIVDRPVKVEQ